MSGRPTPFAVLMVCTGNIGRSPMMERLMRRQIEEAGAAGQFVVASAGTWAQAGHGLEPYASQVLVERGADASGFAATPLTAELVTRADLVLTATREHRSRAVNLAPSAVRRSFTLLELERVVRGVDLRVAGQPVHTPPGGRPSGAEPPPGGRPAQAVAWAAQMRGAVPRPLDESADDLGDPLGEPVEVYRARADAISAALEQIVPFLLGLRRAADAG